ncbi:OPT family small oligopeptide transporter [Endogone sp. FLAS-F59071]|nr:OPT family small oligopeptide transporter [Endogone sp. FLAS-F59071]|eukprot:RUS20908.1 OPT family small oligopeptide transporter [Endogone sp. FLAS-F59071]
MASKAKEDPYPHEHRGFDMVTADPRYKRDIYGNEFTEVDFEQYDTQYTKRYNVQPQYTDNQAEYHTFEEDEDENSPIEEVRATVSNTDDYTLPVMTFRFWLLGILFTIGLSFINQFFWFRDSPITLTPLVVQLLTFPLGRFLEKIIPIHPFFNPGPFNMKEHVLITTMANCCYQTAYAIDIITVQKMYYGQDIGWGGGLLLVLTTQLLGYGMAGVLRPYLVWPSAMVWPINLVNVALFRSFHVPEAKGRQLTRLQFFLIAFACQFVYYWFPGYIFQVLTLFSWICWIAPDNVILSQLTAAYGGLGMLSLSFDWATITAYLGSPLITPWWATANILFGFVSLAWIIVPLIYYRQVKKFVRTFYTKIIYSRDPHLTRFSIFLVRFNSNTWSSQTFPIVSASLFTVEGGLYNKSMIINADKSFNETLYEAYGPLRITGFFAMTYGIGFAALSSVLTHTYLYHGQQIVEQWKRCRTGEDDIHMKLMRRYPEVPDYWYHLIFFLSLGAAFCVIYAWPIDLPWWGLLIAVALACIFVLPIGIITAITNQTPGINVITELVIGFALPGHPIANVTFKTYGYISMTQALTFVSDLKLGHYTKVPPRAMFWAQLVSIGTIIAGIVNLGTARWLLATVPHICTNLGFPWTCRYAQTFYSASIIWGIIGPAKMFGQGSIYSPIVWFFLFGAVLPIPIYFLAKRYPNTWIQYIHIPLMLGATGIMPPAYPINFTMWFVLAFIFMFYVRKYHNAWWMRYNYVLSGMNRLRYVLQTAMDSGVAISGLVIFAVQSGGYNINWWGSK